MIKIKSTYLSYYDYGKLYESLKNGGFIKLGESLGLHIEHHDGKYVEISLVAVGGMIDEKVYFKDMNTTRPKKEKPKKEKPKPPVENEVQGTYSGEEELFG